MGPSPASSSSQRSPDRQGCSEQGREGSWFLPSQISVSLFGPGSAGVGSPRDSPAGAGALVKVHGRARAGNTRVSPGQGVQGQEQPEEVAPGGSWAGGQVLCEGCKGRSLLGGRREQEVT